ncbi:hypothetical protein ACEV91_15500 [Vibrio parahaemolyticus]|nr:hypothetical protein ABK16_12480 [Vibrio parahaemolyticus]
MVIFDQDCGIYLNGIYLVKSNFNQMFLGYIVYQYHLTGVRKRLFGAVSQGEFLMLLYRWEGRGIVLRTDVAWLWGTA